jgi:hypothetical protein
MAVMAFVLFPVPHQLMPNSVAFWLLMQVGMIIGFPTSWPANVWLVNRGNRLGSDTRLRLGVALLTPRPDEPPAQAHRS